jgi:hypothetical protein
MSFVTTAAATTVAAAAVVFQDRALRAEAW